MIIELNEKQAHLIAEALEQYARMICGQLHLSKMPSLQQELYKGQELNDEFWERRDEVEETLEQLRKLVFPNLRRNESYPIQYDSNADLAYEMYKMILYHFQMKLWAEQGKDYKPNVHSYTPLKLTNEPLIKITE